MAIFKFNVSSKERIITIIISLIALLATILSLVMVVRLAKSVFRLAGSIEDFSASDLLRPVDTSKITDSIAQGISEFGATATDALKQKLNLN